MTEKEIHQSIVQYLKGTAPAWIGMLPARALCHHSPNGGQRLQFRLAQIRKGMVAGWPDLELLIHPEDWISEDNWAPIFLEIKNEKGRLSKGQELVIDQLQSIGCPCFVVRSVEEVRTALEPYVRLRDAT